MYLGRRLTGVTALLWASYAPAAILPSTNDLWDISQGAVITATSGPHAPYSDIRDMFGGMFSEVEPGHAIFSDSQPAGFVHYVEWKTPTAVTVGSFNLFGFGDSTQNWQREFAQFVLKAKSSPLATNFDLTLYTLVVTNHPYNYVDPANVCIVSTNITPVTSQYFRAEFLQYTAGYGFDGPRIVELDGFPASGPVILAGPTNDTVAAGQTATFTVNAGGQSLAYQWYENSTNIPIAQNSSAGTATLVLNNTRLAQSGNTYYVAVSNAFGNTNSTSAMLTVNPVVCTPAPSGMVDWWQAEGNAYDSVGTNKGTFVGGVTFAPGEVGQAFSFDGSTGFVSNTPTAAGISGTFTIEFWAYPTGARASTPQANNGITGISNQRYAIFPGHLSGNSAGAGVSVGTNGISVFEHEDNYLPSLLVYNAPITGWTHIAVVYVNEQPSLYVNGVLVATGVTSTKTTYASMCLGEDANGYGYYSGLLDEVSIYNRALSAVEIQTIYNAGAAGKCMPPLAITSQPQPETLYAGSTATFTVNAAGGQPLSYQWQENMTNIPPALNPTAATATLVLSNINVSQSGNVYSVLITNLEGSTNSTSAELTVLAPGSCVPAPSGIVSWWPGERSGLDIIGTNNGTLVSGLTFAPGEVGQAFKFNGSSGYVSVPASTSMANVGLGSGMTVEMWINPADANLRPLVEWNNGTGSNNGYGVVFWINQPPPFGTGTGSIYANVVDTSGQGHDVVAPPNLIQTNVFQHVALTYDRASGVGRIFYNGVQVGQQTIGSFAVQTGYPFYFGYRPWGADAGTLFNGKMDEVSLYNRALSATEIQFIYQAGSGGKCSEPEISLQPLSQVGYWGGTATLGVSVAGTGPFTYQWNYNGAAIGGATNATLMLGDLQFTNAGAYTVTVGNQFGTQTSAPAYLTVNPSGVSIALYAGIDITGVPGLTYGIQYSTNLNNTNNWLGLANVTLTQTNELYFDLQPATAAHRYYRVLPGPISIP